MYGNSIRPGIHCLILHAILNALCNDICIIKGKVHN